jgi:molybdate transport system substrate-binding protein
MNTLHLLCAGAAQGLVQALQARFGAQTGARIEARFGAVGALKEALLGGAPCQVMIVTQSMIDSLVAAGRLQAGSGAVLGRVHTGIAVPAGAPLPKLGSGAELKAALLASSAIYFPDPQRATAGIHFARVMQELGVHDILQPRFRTYPAGAIAMRELAAAQGPDLIGCTQVSEILITPGVSLVAPLPRPFELATAYGAAVGAQPGSPELAALAGSFVDLLAAADTQALRVAAGFDVA